MTRYLMREKLLAFGDDYVIRDDAERERFFVDGRAFSIGDKLSFQDMRGRELAFIKQKLLAWGPTYEIWREGELVAEQHVAMADRDHVVVEHAGIDRVGILLRVNRPRRVETVARSNSIPLTYSSLPMKPTRKALEVDLVGCGAPTR